MRQLFYLNRNQQSVFSLTSFILQHHSIPYNGNDALHIFGWSVYKLLWLLV